MFDYMTVNTVYFLRNAKSMVISFQSSWLAWKYLSASLFIITGNFGLSKFLQFVGKSGIIDGINFICGTKSHLSFKLYLSIYLQLFEWNLYMYFLPSANEVCKGYAFTRVCHSVQGVSRPIPRGEVEGSGQEGPPGHTRGGDWGLAGEVSRPIPRGRLRGLAWGGCIPPCTEADSAPSPADGYCCGRLLDTFLSSWSINLRIFSFLL